MKKIFLFLFAIVCFAKVFSTHNRAGEITYRQISELTYEITVVTYTSIRPGVIADRDEIDVLWGDNTYSILPRIEKKDLPDYYRRNVYIGTHTFPGAATYEIVMMDPNRNQDVLNIPGSVNVMFTIKTTLQINPLMGYNNTPVLYCPPVDKAKVGEIFLHNPAAFDADGDSLSYKLDTCLGEDGRRIPDYRLPPTSNTISVNPVTGDFIWDAPTRVGIYNVAIAIEEWRNGVKIGKIIRDIQIEVQEAENEPPYFDSLATNICVRADSLIDFMVTARDTVKDRITLTAYGGPFELKNSPATFNQNVIGYRKVRSFFRWKTNCSHVRKQPYTVVFKAEDNHPILKLAGFLNVYIRVIAPPPENFSATAINNSIILKWSPSICTQAAGYKIYRRNSYKTFIPDICETGVPDSLGYKLIATLKKLNDTSYVDKNLKQGFSYCYLIIAYFKDGGESYASQPVCAELKKSLPIITKTSVSHTSTTNGTIRLEWIKPLDLDTNQFPPPYRYVISASDDLEGQNFQFLAFKEGINNTSHLDSMFNTEEKPRIYRIELQNFYNQQWSTLGTGAISSTPFLTLLPADEQVTLTVSYNVPWENTEFLIYRKNLNSENFEFIALAKDSIFIDKHLSNGKEYGYFVKVLGHYSVSELPDLLTNLSQQVFTSPLDTFAACQPPLEVQSVCDSSYNRLIWKQPKYICANSNDIIRYKILYKSTLNGDFDTIAVKNSPNDTTFQHFSTTTLAGCYAIVAVDSFGNESAVTQKSCIDNCVNYSLPNVFSPNADNVNDEFRPFPYQFVEKVNMKIYSRWGELVFQTENPDIKWDGKNMNTKKIVPSGVYYYICDVFENRLGGLVSRNITGFIHVFSSEKNAKP